ncbi:hypothetical protein [Bacillus sp. FJAT-27251]|jgi:hypothetical protein|uniref:DUF6904 family protein n=1 Tax=Bacillus sp. FJAT-27251 TaxID=1684142 RepID=UPI0006A7D055|nr:hypothetical protein [Bacillus sp. FJAT-27251]
MIYLENTANNAGVIVYGDQFDFNGLYNSLHTIVGDEDEWISFEGPRLRVLGVCYDIRHAMMGGRGIEFVDNGLDQGMMRNHGIITNEKNVYLSFQVLWPELLFVAMALNDFIKLYAKKQANKSYNPELDFRNMWNPAIAAVRGFQAAIANCIQETVPATSFTRVMKLMNKEYTWFDGYITQYLDELNIKFLEMDKEKRLKNITIIAKRIAEQGLDYKEIKLAVEEAARKYNCHVTNIKTDLEYPDEIDW